MPTPPRLPDDTALGWVELRVADRERALRFYHEVLGYLAELPDERTAYLRPAPDRPAHVVLSELPGAVRRAPRSTGLYHAAILLPHRRELARVLRRLADVGWPISGVADHGVSEAIYLDDAEGNGIEIYADRPHGAWPVRDGQLAMYTDPLDLPDLLRELETDPRPWSTMPAGARIGHVHLQVSDLAKAEEFYCTILGFEVTQRSYPGALFVSAGGYHHHLGLNIWNSRRAGPPPDNATGLIAFAVVIPERVAWEHVVARVRAAGLPIEEGLRGEYGVGVATRDFDRIGVELWTPIA
jgi:catechol 2,3-dioxygenase